MVVAATRAGGELKHLIFAACPVAFSDCVNLFSSAKRGKKGLPYRTRRSKIPGRAAALRG